jgi:hypothetical protein
MKTSLIIVTTIAFTLAVQFGFRVLTARPSSHFWEHVVLTEDVTLKYGDEVVGTLQAGTTVHAPCRHDTAYTEPFDPQTYKIYVEFGYPTPMAEYTMPRSQFYDEGGHARNVVDVYVAADLNTKGEQDESLKP